MPRVFVVNKPLGPRDPETGTRSRARTDLSAAERYGEIGHLLSSEGGPLPMDPAPTVADLERRLDEVEFGPDDYLITLGDMLACAAAAFLAARRGGGTVRVLRWSAGDRDYHPVDLKLWDDPAAAARALDYAADRI